VESGASAPFPPPPRPASPTYGAQLLHSFASWIVQFEQPDSVAGVVLGSALTILDGVLTIFAIANAYNTCL
jgi:hypothetical protein